MYLVLNKIRNSKCGVMELLLQHHSHFIPSSEGEGRGGGRVPPCISHTITCHPMGMVTLERGVAFAF